MTDRIWLDHEVDGVTMRWPHYPEPPRNDLEETEHTNYTRAEVCALLCERLLGSTSSECVACDGTGRIIEEQRDCSLCGGRGWLCLDFFTDPAASMGLRHAINNNTDHRVSVGPNGVDVWHVDGDGPETLLFYCGPQTPETEMRAVVAAALRVLEEQDG